ncbi:cation:proton antiporter [Motilimonas sp. KMU-193]|uniref:cation:proton antiporter n=1 Tax=Motilimonas sp. KMU-193 TaxID=3388668 RepID=UPI00396AF3F5
MELEHAYKLLGILAGIVFLYTLIAKRIENSCLSGPMVYVTLGLILGPLGFALIGNTSQASSTRLLIDITLALILFSDAAHSNITVLKKKVVYPTRMLLLGLPASILLGFIAAAVLFNQLSLLEAAILATMLAATDAALGKAVVTNEQVPAAVREGLNVESGLNDGLCVPILLLLISMASAGASDHFNSFSGLIIFAKELGIGAMVGLGMAYLGAKLLFWSQSKQWLSEVWCQLTVAAMALCSLGLAQAMEGSGYIAAFSGGLLFGHLMKRNTHKLVLTTESLAELMAMLTWIVFGAVVVSTVYTAFSLSMVLYAIISLTLIRMLPVYLCFAGTKVPSQHRLFMGWFGPRGLASIVFAIIVIDAELPNSNFIALTVTCTVLLSLVLHGISAKPMAQRLANKTDK